MTKVDIISDEEEETSRLLSPFHPKFKSTKLMSKSNNNSSYQTICDDNDKHREVSEKHQSSDMNANNSMTGSTMGHNSRAPSVASLASSTALTVTYKSETNLLTAANEPQKRRHIPALGIFLAFMSVLCYSLGSAIVNLLPALHSLEILLIRSTFQFISFGFLVLVRGYSIVPADGHHMYLALRCISGTITLTTVFVAYRMMPLADASTIQFSSPVFVAIFAYFMLRELLSWLQAVAGLVTLVGVVVIAQPEFIFGSQADTVYDQRLLGTVLAVVSSLSGAFSMITLRKLKSTPVPVIVMWYALVVIVVTLIILFALDALVMPWGWYTWGLLIGVGVFGVGDQYFVSKAMQYENAGPVSVTRTLTVVMTFVWEAVILGETIEWLSLLGATIITSCILLLAVDKWRHESPETFSRLSSYCCCYCRCREMSDDYYDSEETLGKPFADRYADQYYDSITDYKHRNQLYYNQFEVAIDGSPNGPNVTQK
ncbi:solute carrier family 35 member G1-like [Oppia nitens]|uniref:solute carrier family 35 member G1-like n=1 Tax=Oppia nitens TaxID=1686743 RepID=UPI0023DB32DB|nr:solute carrier family 35 member G1-like [Oppia nitens]